MIQKQILIACLLITASIIYADNEIAPKKAIIIGASSGMGREVAKRLSQAGYTVGLVARRMPQLESLKAELPGPSFIKQIDVTTQDARQQLQDLITTMNGVDLAVIGISSYLDNRNAQATHDKDYSPKKTWAEKERTLNVDAKGFIAMADVLLEHFMQKNNGHLVGISSTSGQRGVAYNPEYAAAKACISYYMEAQRNYMKQNNIPVHITDIVPGYVAVEHSPLGEDPSAYWEISVEEAGAVIMDGIKKQEEVVYVPRRVWLVAMLLKYLPDTIYNNYLPWI